MKFSANLQNLRKQQQISQEQLADRLNVSRQSVSKWESGDSYPETEKLIAICQIFNCTMDDLVMGEISASSKTKPTSQNVNQTEILEQYDQLMNQFSRGIALGVGIILLGVTALLSIMGLRELGGQSTVYYDTFGIVALLCSAVIGVPFFIIYSLKLANFKLKHPKIEATYPETAIEQYTPKFITGITLGVAILILGAAVMILLQGTDIFSYDSALPPAVFVAFTAVAVPILTLVGIRRGKYDLSKYNQERIPTNHKNEILIGKICGVIMLIAIIIFLSLGIISNLWQSAWFVFPIGGLLCGIVGTILGDNVHH